MMCEIQHAAVSAAGPSSAVGSACQKVPRDAQARSESWPEDEVSSPKAYSGTRGFSGLYSLRIVCPNDSEVPLVYSSYQARRRRAAMADP